MRKFVCGFVILVATAPGPVLAQLDRSGPPSAQNALAQDAHRVELGETSFRQLCTGCHGRSGQGGQGEGQGPNLATNWEVRRAKDPELFGFIRNGVKGTAMPAFDLPDERIWELAAYVRSLNAQASMVPVAGNAQAGAALFETKGKCSGCHMIRGKGGYLGPDLSNVGATRRLSELRTALTNPSSAPSAEYQPVLVSDAAGQQVRAVAKHVSPWSAELIDEKGNLHLVHADEVRTLAFQKKSWMPSANDLGLSAEDVDNLLAYLSRQTVRSISDGEKHP